MAAEEHICQYCKKPYTYYENRNSGGEKRKYWTCSEACRSGNYRIIRKAKEIELALEHKEYWRIDKMRVGDLKRLGFHISMVRVDAGSPSIH